MVLRSRQPQPGRQPTISGTTRAAWCVAQGITLVEDCSHVFFTEQHSPPNIGKHGQFVVSSPYKFLPSPNGGLLYAQAADQLQDLHLLHLPCHQSLDDRELDWMIATVKKLGADETA